MFRPSKKLMFAIEAVLFVSYNGTDGPVQSSEITKHQGIPRRYLEQVLQQLVRAGILAGVRGPRGGYRLGRERRRISLADIIAAIMDSDEEATDLGGSPLGLRVVKPVIEEVQAGLDARLGEITLADLNQRAATLGIARTDQPAVDYTI